MTRQRAMTRRKRPRAGVIALTAVALTATAFAGPARAPAVPLRPDASADGAVLTLFQEMARVQRRIELLQQEQQQLMRRFHELTAKAAAPSR